MSYPSWKSRSLSDSPFYSVRTLSVAQCFITKGVDKSLYTYARMYLTHVKSLYTWARKCMRERFFLDTEETRGGEKEIRGEIWMEGVRKIVVINDNRELFVFVAFDARDINGRSWISGASQWFHVRGSSNRRGINKNHFG